MQKIVVFIFFMAPIALAISQKKKLQKKNAKDKMR
jgi:preprotein translocase subunit SecG